MTLVLQTENLTKRFGRVIAVDSLSLSVDRGDIFGFLGRNGAGKSTTLRMLVGLIRPSSGSVMVLGQDVRKVRSLALKRVGAIIESPAFYDHFTGIQNLRLFADMSGGAHRGRIAEVLRIVDLTARASDPVRVYSHGMRQRLGIAQALLPDPKLIILDEPTDGLDPQGILEMRNLIRRLRDDLGLTVMLSSHLLNEVEQLCNRIAIIERGKLIYQGGVEQLLDADQTFKITVDRAEEAVTFISKLNIEAKKNGDGSIYIFAPGDRIAEINSLLVQQGLKVSELSKKRESLEDVFFRLTSRETP